MFYRGTVLDRDTDRRGAVTVRFPQEEDRRLFWFPADQVRQWLADARRRAAAAAAGGSNGDGEGGSEQQRRAERASASPPAPPPTTGPASDWFAAEVLRDMSMSLSTTAAAPSGSASGDGDGGSTSSATSPGKGTKGSTGSALRPTGHPTRCGTQRSPPQSASLSCVPLLIQCACCFPLSHI